MGARTFEMFKFFLIILYKHAIIVRILNPRKILGINILSIITLLKKLILLYIKRATPQLLNYIFLYQLLML